MRSPSSTSVSTCPKRGRQIAAATTIASGFSSPATRIVEAAGAHRATTPPRSGARRSTSCRRATDALGGRSAPGAGGASLSVGGGDAEGRRAAQRVAGGEAGGEPADQRVAAADRVDRPRRRRAPRSRIARSGVGEDAAVGAEREPDRAGARARAGSAPQRLELSSRSAGLARHRRRAEQAARLGQVRGDQVGPRRERRRKRRRGRAVEDREGAAGAGRGRRGGRGGRRGRPAGRLPQIATIRAGPASRSPLGDQPVALRGAERRPPARAPRPGRLAVDRRRCRCRASPPATRTGWTGTGSAASSSTQQLAVAAAGRGQQARLGAELGGDHRHVDRLAARRLQDLAGPHDPAAGPPMRATRSIAGLVATAQRTSVRPGPPSDLDHLDAAGAQLRDLARAARRHR